MLIRVNGNTIGEATSLDFVDGSAASVDVEIDEQTGRAVVTLQPGVPILKPAQASLGSGLEDDPYTGASSFQPLAADLNLGPHSGRDAATGTSFLGAIMGNVIGDTLTRTANYLAGLIGHYNVLGAKESTYPAGAVLAGIGDGVTEADGAFVAYIDGDDNQTNAGAAFKVRSNNSTAGSGFDFGVDLQDAAHDGYHAVDKDFYKKACLRLVSDVVVLAPKAGAPTNGTTGKDVAGPGSLYIDITAGKLYINTNTKASPTWTVVGTQS